MYFVAWIGTSWEQDNIQLVRKAIYQIDGRLGLCGSPVVW